MVAARQLEYCFDAARSKRDRYTHGQGSMVTARSAVTPSPARRRVSSLVFPKAARGAVEKFICYLRDGIPAHKAYQAGFAKTFGLVNPRFDLVPVGPASSPAQSYRATMLDALSHGDLPDAAIIVVTDRDGDLPDCDNNFRTCTARPCS